MFIERGVPAKRLTFKKIFKILVGKYIGNTSNLSTKSHYVSYPRHHHHFFYIVNLHPILLQVDFETISAADWKAQLGTKINHV